jgi:glucokinase
VLNGRIYRGATGAAPEYGHIIVGADLSEGVREHLETFPQPGSLESLATGGALDRLARAEGLKSGHAAVDQARRGNGAALRVMRVYGERVGVGVANAINVFDPYEVVIGGGVSSAGDLFLAHTERVARMFALPGVGTETIIRLARHANRAGVLGAALLASQEFTS